MAARDDLLVWIDLEMTGLDPDQCFIIEIATLVSDESLNILAEGPSLVVRAGEAELATLSDWSRKTFTASGLLERCRVAEHDVAAAEAATLAFLEPLVKPGRAPLCGNSVHTDRAFLWRHMRTLHDFLHYRNVDVSSWKEMLRRWYPKAYDPPRKAGSHEALTDIRESIEELAWYRDTFVRAPDPS